MRPAKAGAMQIASAKANARRNWAGTAVSPKPGSSMTIEPTRANRSATAQISTP
jgi:hypothetical protein